MSSAMKVLFVQAQGLMAQGGSSKILRALTANAPLPLGSLVCGTRRPAAEPADINEWFVRERATFGRLERTKLATFCKLSRAFSWAASCQSVRNIMSQWQPLHVHAHLHGIGFIPALAWCRDKGIPFSVSVHDDIRHLTSADPWRRAIELSASEAWLAAANRFVISAEIGEEYSRRYGERHWIQITDGVDNVAPVLRPFVPNRLNVYFAGALNVPYEPNFIALQQALKGHASNHPGDEVRLIARGGRSLKNEVVGAPRIEVRAFAPPAEVSKDFQEADFLYLPLSLESKYSNFAKYSLSTKMITYLASGVPIFYHGPPDAAVYRLLAKHNACLACFTNDPVDIMMAFDVPETRKRQVAQNALNLGRQEFRLKDIQERFWSAVIHASEARKKLSNARS